LIVARPELWSRQVACHQICIWGIHGFWIDKSLNKRKGETIEGMEEVNLNKLKNKK